MQTNTKFLLVFFLLSILTIAPDLVAQNHSYDQYGGRLDIQLDKGTGFFCLGEVEGKHFLITPEGNAYKALGLNHMHTTSRKDYDKIIDELKALGFNSGDYQGPNWQWNRIPYTKGVNLTKTSIWLSEDKFEFEDVFAESFLIEMEENIKNTVSPQANNKMLIAYFLTDVPRWNGSQYGSSWLEFFKSLDNSTSGKIVWNQWKSNNPDTPEDDFLALIARQIYSKGIGFIRKYDPNHMVFTERYWETNIPEQVVAEALPFVDGIATQPSNHVKKEFYDYLTNKYKLPIYVADHVTSYATAEYPITMGQVASNPTDYLEFYTSAVQTALSHPFVIGYNKCQYQDEAKPTQLKQGLYRADASPYPYLENLDEVHQNALELGHYLPTDKYTDQLLDWGEYENTKREAYDRIDQYRKGDEHLKVILPGDEIATNSEIRIKLKQHDFKWGAVVKESFVTSPHKEKYKEIFPKYFNATGFGVACKPKFRGTSREQNLLNNAMPFFLNNDVYVRGHTLTWEGINFIRPEDKAIYENNSLSDEVKADSMLASMGKHFPHAIPQWDVEAWDVSNEPIANNLVNDLLPDYNTHVHWFKLADSIRNTCGKGDVLLFQNDYQIISAISSWAMGRPAKYREILDEQIALGAPIEGIGFQSRLKHGLITPDTIYKRLCDFDRYNLPYHATEFEIRDDANKYVYTDDERRLLTEYMMVMYFSHPKVKLFTHWTFADARSTENLDYPLFNYDGTPKVNGKIWIDLMEGFFNTAEMFSSDGNGELDVHGYYGSYDLIFESGNDFFLGSFRIDSSTAESVLEVHLDKGFNLTGLEDSLIYALDEDINIEIEAFSIEGDISSIDLRLNNKSLASVTDSSLSVTYTPTTIVEGWNEVQVKVVDDQGNKFEHSIPVFFGDPKPVIEITSQPADTIITKTTGNNIAFTVEGKYSPIEYLFFSFSGKEIILPDPSENFSFPLDTLQPGNYYINIKAYDQEGRQAMEYIEFTVILDENILPFIEITSPKDSSILFTGNNALISIDARDADGILSSVEIFLNDTLVHTFYESPYDRYLGSLNEGVHSIVAVATDDREGIASHSVIFTVHDTTTSTSLYQSTSGFIFYPNPVSNTLYFNKNCNYEIYTILGRKILKGEESNQVDVSTLKDGLYLLKTNYGVSTLKKVL